MMGYGVVSTSNQYGAAGKLGAKSNGLLNEALCKKVMSDLLKTSAPTQPPPALCPLHPDYVAFFATDNFASPSDPTPLHPRMRKGASGLSFMV